MSLSLWQVYHGCPCPRPLWATPICVQPMPMPWCSPGADTVPVPTRAMPGHPLHADTCGVGHLSQLPPVLRCAPGAAPICVLTPLMCQCQPCADAKCVPRHLPVHSWPGTAQHGGALITLSAHSPPPGPNTAFSSRTIPLFFTSRCLWPFHFHHMDNRERNCSAWREPGLTLKTTVVSFQL